MLWYYLADRTTTFPRGIKVRLLQVWVSYAFRDQAPELTGSTILCLPNQDMTYVCFHLMHPSAARPHSWPFLLMYGHANILHVLRHT